MDVSLSGIEAMAQSGGESVEINCTGDCSTDGCSISGYSNPGCVAGGCYDNCVCSGYDEEDNRVQFVEECTPIAR